MTTSVEMTTIAGLRETPEERELAIENFYAREGKSRPQTPAVVVSWGKSYPSGIRYEEDPTTGVMVECG